MDQVAPEGWLCLIIYCKQSVENVFTDTVLFINVYCKSSMNQTHLQWVGFSQNITFKIFPDSCTISKKKYLQKIENMFK